MKLSLVMVVRDEAETLERAVENVSRVVDEVVIGVDDKCTDDTPNIAKKLATTCFDFTFEDDFSKARNLAIAKATGDLILILDGHEFICPDDHPAPGQFARMRRLNPQEETILTPLSLIEQIKQQGLPEAFDLACFTVFMNVDIWGIPQLFFLQPRLFYNNRGIHYNNPVHNYLDGYRPDAVIGFAEGILVHNMPPKREQARQKQRKKMNVGGLMKDVRYEWTRPLKEQSGRPFFYLGNTYADMGMAEKAIFWYERYLPRSKFDEERYQAIQQLAVLYYRHRHDIPHSKELALTAAGMNHKRAEPFILLGEIAFENNSLDEALHYYNLAAQIPAPATVMFMQGAVYSYMPDFKRMQIYAAMGNFGKALECAELVKTWRDDDSGIVNYMNDYKKQLARGQIDKFNFLWIDQIGSFTPDLIAQYQDEFRCELRKTCDHRWKAWADLVWIEWCDQNAIQWSKVKWGGPVIIRLHSYEAFTDMPGMVDWSNVDALVFVAEHIRDLTLEKWPSIKDKTKIYCIPNGVKTEGLTFKERGHGDKVGFLGYLNPKKGIDILWWIARALPQYTFNVAGNFQDNHLTYFSRHTIADLHNVRWHGWVPLEEKDVWLDENADYLISPSIVESFGYSLAESMAKGIKPLIYDRQGVWWKESFRTIEELKALLDPNSPYESQVYRAIIIYFLPFYLVNCIGSDWSHFPK